MKVMATFIMSTGRIQKSAAAMSAINTSRDRFSELWKVVYSYPIWQVNKT